VSDAIKSFSQIPRREEKPPNAEYARQRVIAGQGRAQGEKVVNSSHVKWEPIDKVARRVVAEAPDICKPPRPEPVFMKEDKIKDEKLFTDSEEGGRLKAKKLLNEEGYTERHYSAESVAIVAVDSREKELKDTLKVKDELVRKAKELVDTIEYLSTQLRQPYIDTKEELKAIIATLREDRIALGSETRLLLQSLKEVRQFFLDESYTEQVTRLRDFIDLCERLKTLKENGFLDAVADTILKL